MKKLVKSVLTLIVTLSAVLVLVACNPSTDRTNTLVVGSPEISGNFMAGFGNSAYDVWVRDLISGYGTYAVTPLGEIVLNETVVKTVTTSEADRVVGSGATARTVKDKTYTFVLEEDLLWSDGVAITAKDYVFGILMSASRNWVTAGASSTVGDSLLGYAAYRTMANPNYDATYDPTKDAAWQPYTEAQFDVLFDEDDFEDYAAYLKDYRAKYLAALPATHKKNATINRTTSEGVKFQGVKLLGDYSFSVTIDGTKLPYFYETSYASFGPAPMHVLAPATAAIESNETGANVTVGGFSLLADAAKVGGFRYNPIVSSGPYKFVSFVNQVVTLVRNENFKGNYAGKTPTIENIIIKRVNQTLDVDLVISGEIDLVTGVIEGSKIQAAQAAASTSTQYYSRNGYGLLAMQAHFGPTMDYRVRQAIAHLTDRQYVTDQVLDGYGSIVYSEYGLAQWMYVQSEDWVNANINKYNFSVTQANTILATTEWKYESDGTTLFDPAKASATANYFRHNAAKEVLEIKHFGTENNEITTSLQAKFVLNMPLAGIKYTIQIGTFDELLDHYYYAYDIPVNERIYHIFNLATNFSVAYDPYYSWHSNFLGTWQNAHQLKDTPTQPAAPLATGEKTLDELTTALRTVAPGDNVTYLALWKEYQLRWNKLIPNVPLYSNQYYDVFDVKLKGVETTPFWNWAAQINEMYFEE